MKRLFEIVYILLDKECVTARELAEHFEVSTRTIYRDVEALSGAGIPIYMNQGKGGGIRLIGSYILNKSILSDQEQTQIIAALQGMKAVNYPEGNETLSKLGVLFQKELDDWIEVDFSGWGNQYTDDFAKIKRAILANHMLKFTYYNAKGIRGIRLVEPYKICFKERNWYLLTFCTDKMQPRLFKLSRMKNIIVLDQMFDPSTHSEIRNLDLMGGREQEENTEIILLVDSFLSYRVYDEFEEEQIQKKPNGDFIVTMRFIIDEWVYGYLLSFGEHAKVIKPAIVKMEINRRLLAAYKRYEESDDEQE